MLGQYCGIRSIFRAFAIFLHANVLALAFFAGKLGSRRLISSGVTALPLSMLDRTLLVHARNRRSPVDFRILAYLFIDSLEAIHNRLVAFGLLAQPMTVSTSIQRK